MIVSNRVFKSWDKNKFRALPAGYRGFAEEDEYEEFDIPPYRELRFLEFDQQNSW